MQWKEPDKVGPYSPLTDMLEKISLYKLGAENPKEGIFVPFSQMCQGDVTKLVTIDTTSTWQFETPVGSIWRVRQVTKKGKRLRSYIEDASSLLETSSLESLKRDIPIDYGSWEITIDSPPVAGSRPSLKVKEEGTKDQAMHTLGIYAVFFIVMQEYLKKALDLLKEGNIEAFQRGAPAEVKPYFKDFIDIRSFGPLYRKALTASWPIIDGLEDSFEQYLTEAQLNWITVLLLHEACIYNNRRSVEEGEEMAKKNSGMVWWSITGGQSSLGKVTNSLTKDRHFLVLDSPTSIFLRIQKNENTFATGIVRDNNCKLVPTEEPEYQETLCGKRHTHATTHSRRCQGCIRVKDNIRRAEESAAVKEADKIVTSERAMPSTSSPDGKYNSGVRSTLPNNPTLPPKSARREEDMEWKSRNGAVITIKAPQIELTDDFTLAAQEYEEISEWFLTKSTEYAELATKLKTFGQPSQAVQEAEAALAAARQRDEDQRAKDKADIIAAIASTKKED